MLPTNMKCNNPLIKSSIYTHPQNKIINKNPEQYIYPSVYIPVRHCMYSAHAPNPGETKLLANSFFMLKHPNMPVSEQL